MMTAAMAAHYIGEKCLFQPNLNKSEWCFENKSYRATDPYSAVECEITEVIFSCGKVYYSIEVRYVEQGDELKLSIQRVNSLMICKLE